MDAKAKRKKSGNRCLFDFGFKKAKLDDDAGSGPEVFVEIGVDETNKRFTATMNPGSKIVLNHILRRSFSGGHLQYYRDADVLTSTVGRTRSVTVKGVQLGLIIITLSGVCLAGSYNHTFYACKEPIDGTSKG